MKFISKNSLVFLLVAILLLLISTRFYFRIDLTSDKRHSLSPQSKSLMKSVREPISAKIYLSGDLNSGFLKLQKSTIAILEELGAYSSKKMIITSENPSDAATAAEREEKFFELQSRGLVPTSVFEKDKEGKAMQKILFPWVELSYKGKTIPVNLLKNIPGLSGEENLNISIENLEFELTDAIRRLSNEKVQKIAFLEGHGELNEWETYDISRSLSRYFQIDRGVIGTDANILNGYKAIIIAKPTEKFSEKDKFVIDQYIMTGGSVLWLLDAVQTSDESLSQIGQTPAIPYDLNLTDMLFRYGVRINPLLIQDVQSVLVPVNVAPKGQSAEFQPMPLVYSPLLLTSLNHSISKNLPPVKAHFASPIELVGENKNVRADLILASSENTHLVQTPANISLSEIPDLKDKNYFNLAYVPVAVSLEGEFQSVFANRMPPPEIESPPAIKKTSERSRQIFIADGNIIRNEIQHTGDSIEALPLGLDRYTQQQYGNKDLIVNSILYLTDKDGWMNLRSRTIPLRLLNKNLVISQRTKWQTINVILPLAVLFIFGLLYEWIRRRKYTK